MPMTLRLALSGLLLGGALAACTQAGTSNSTASSSNVVSITPEIRAEIERRGEDPDEEVCKRMEDTGSTIPRNVCATRAAWAAQEWAARQGVEDMQNNALRTRAPGSGG